MINEKIKLNLITSTNIETSYAALLGALAQNLGQDVQEKSLDVDAEAYIIVDFDTGQILQGKDIDEPLEIASMSKMIVEYILFEEVDAGNISWDKEVSISDHAYQISQNYELSNVPLRSDDTYTIKELYEAMAIY